MFERSGRKIFRAISGIFLYQFFTHLLAIPSTRTLRTHRAVVFLVVFSLLYGDFHSIYLGVPRALAAEDIFTTAGTNTWVAPANTFQVTVQVWGGGGGSGGGTNTVTPGGSGGGGGAYASKVISVTPGVGYSYTVGAAGAVDGGTAGGNSSFTGDGGVQALACGGTSGAVNGGAAGAGGTTACSDGTTEYAGGAGAVGTGTSGGGGGESASTTANGNDAISTAGGTGTAGTDGSAGQLIGVAGVAGNNPGAGAGGSGRRSGGSEAGATGGVGRVHLTHSPAALTVSGTLYTNEGVTTYNSGKTIRLRVGTSTPGLFSATSNGSGVYSFTNLTGIAPGIPLSVWVDADSSFRAFAQSKASSGVSNIANFDLYQNRIIVKHEGVSGTTTSNAELGLYDGDDDADIQFTANTNNLVANKGQELHVASGKTYAPGGTVTLHGNAAAGPDGDFHLESGVSTPVTNYVAGRDVTGNSTGNQSVHVYSLAVSGNSLYVGKQGDATACNGTAGNAIGCELLVFNISTPTNPTLVAGRDVKGDSTGTGSLFIYSLVVSGSYLYVGKSLDATACNGTAGNAIGCELLVFDISTPSSPTLVAGRDVTGDSTGAGSATINSLTVSGNYLYVGKQNDATACNGTAGNAIGCELLVFDISTPTNPTLVAGRDTKGDSTGTGGVDIYSLTASDNYLYVGKSADATACNGTAGNAIGCELLVFDISTPTNPTLVAGRDVKGDSTGTGIAYVYSLAVSGNSLYVGKQNDATACNGTAGNAIGCELLVFDISTPTNPTLVAGRDVTGNSTGTGSVSIYSLAVSGNYLYVGKVSDVTACNGTAGNAIGCELLVFDISTPSTPTLSTGRDASGDSTGTGDAYIYSLTASDNYLYVGKMGAANPCSQTAGSAIGCEVMTIDISPTAPTTLTLGGTITIAGSLYASSTNVINPNGYGVLFTATTTGKKIMGELTGDSAFASTTFAGSGGTGGSWTYTNNASTTGNLIITNGTVTAPSGTLTIGGNYQNSGTFTNNGGATEMTGAIASIKISTYLAGRDVSGSAAGTDSVEIPAIAVSGNYAFVGKRGVAVSCSQVVGAASGCELMVFDISNPTSPTYVAGLDGDGSAAGTANAVPIYSMAISGNYLYVGKQGNATACSQTAGFAIGCELMVFDISTPTNPVYVAGRDTTGDSTGTGSAYIYSLTTSGNYLYVGTSGNVTACNGTAGNAIGCELLVFDVSTPSSPTLVAGRDVKGDSTGTGALSINSLATSGNYLYMGKTNDATACSQTAGSAIGCELMVFDISTPTSPTYSAGRDASGSAAGTGNIPVLSLTISGNYAYIAKEGDVTACSQTAGSAIGCEFMVFDISTPTSPAYSAGRDASGSAAGTGDLGIKSITTSGNYAYAGKTSDATACSQTAGSAIGCELMVFDISTPTSPTYSAGRDASGSAAGTGAVTIYSVAVSGNYVYVGKNANATACSQTAGSAIGCEFVVFGATVATLSGTLAGASALNHLTVSGPVTFFDNATTSNFTITTSATVTAPSLLTVNGNYSNAGVFTHSSGIVYFGGSSAQSLGGTMTGASSFFSLDFLEAGMKTFSANASTSANLTIESGASVTAPSGLLSIAGSYTNNGSFANNSGTMAIASDLALYLAGRDTDGSAAGTGSASAAAFAVSGNYAYVGKSGNATACSQVIGSAIGCELMVFDISNPSSPIYVAGRDVTADSTGIGNADISSLLVSGNYLYVGKIGNATACSQSAGSAIGCELQVYDITTPTSPTYVAGRDASADSTGTGNADIRYSSLAISGSYLYVGKTGNTTACSQTAGSAIGCELLVFDISTPTSPTYVAGRDISGNSTGTGSSHIYSVSISGNYAYVAQSGVASACSQTAGSANGCEFQVYDISTPTNPTYVAGRDVDGSATGSGSLNMIGGAIYGNYIYLGTSGNVTACAQTVGSAIGCELQVYDITTPTSPTYVAGRDSDGSAAGIGNVLVYDMVISGNYLYVARSGNTTACSQVPGSAAGCELIAFDISTPFSPTYVAGRDSSGNSSGTGGTSVESITASGGNLYGVKTFNTTACSQTAGSAIGCEFMVFRSSASLSGNLAGTSAFKNLQLTGSVTVANNASSSNITINATSTLSAPSLLSISGNYTNSGTFTHNSGLVYLNGAAQQTLTGSMIGSNAFNNLTILNNSGTNPESNPGIIFANTSSTTGTFTATVASTTIRFPAGATTSMGNLTLTGTSASAPIYLRSSTPGSYANLSVSGTRSITFANVQDSHACDSYGAISAIGSTDSGHNLCWTFGATPVLNLLHYRWRMDHENEVSAGYYAAEDTALTNRVYKGDRLRLRMTLQNTGSGPATLYNYRLEYASSSCSAWNNLGTTMEWFADLTQYQQYYSSTTDAGGLSNPGGSTFQSGVFRGGAATTGPYTLPNAFFTEHEFTINTKATAQKNVTYCFRLTNDGSIVNFTYTVQPQILLRGDAHPSSGGNSVEENGTGPAIPGGGQGGGSGGEGSGSGSGQGGGGQGGGGGDSG